MMANLRGVDHPMQENENPSRSQYEDFAAGQS
jgi:hypothetical protein